jgi:FolB domain-containing protein
MLNSPVLDQIFIDQLQISAILGVDPIERVQRQPLLCSLVLYTQTQAAAQSDDLQLTVNYAAICQQVITFVEQSQFFLVETLVEQIATLCLQHPLVQQVQVELAKPVAIRLAKQVGVRIVRCK